MVEATGNLWDYGTHVIGIPTSGFVRTDGRALMARGAARQAQRRFPQFEADLGRLLTRHGNRCFRYLPPAADLTGRHYVFLTFPVKPAVGPKGEPGWMSNADLELIEQSALQASEMAYEFRWKRVAIPRPGCADGGLRWEVVRPVISPILNDCFTILIPVSRSRARRNSAGPS